MNDLLKEQLAERAAIGSGDTWPPEGDSCVERTYAYLAEAAGAQSVFAAWLQVCAKRFPPQVYVEACELLRYIADIVTDQSKVLTVYTADGALSAWLRSDEARQAVAETMEAHYLLEGREYQDADRNSPCACRGWSEGSDITWDEHMAEVSLARLLHCSEGFPRPARRPETA